MEQEVPVIIHDHDPVNPVKEPHSETFIPEQVKEISETLSEAFLRFKESESYDLLVKSADKAKEFIEKNPVQALLYTLGAGAFFGFLLRKKR
ncbi:MAG: hypothetical protein WCI90_07440 [Chlorobium sp.]|nr:MAG: hypothetical protein FDX17_09800 [Chlorobium sp.]